MHSQERTKIPCLGSTIIEFLLKNLGQYDRHSILGCEPVDGVMVVLSSNQLNIAIFVHQMEDVCFYTFCIPLSAYSNLH